MRHEVDVGFADFVRARQHGLLRAAFLVCGDQHLAEDLVQQALVKLALRWDRLRDENPDGYVRRILYRDAVSEWRKTRHEHLGDLPLDAPERDRAGEIDDRLVIERALTQLTPKQRAVIALRFFEDRPEAETAEILEVSIGTVKSQTHAALARLRSVIPDLAPAVQGRSRHD